jgi:hypothetical protein
MISIPKSWTIYALTRIFFLLKNSQAFLSEVTVLKKNLINLLQENGHVLFDGNSVRRNSIENPLLFACRAFIVPKSFRRTVLVFAFSVAIFKLND